MLRHGLPSSNTPSDRPLVAMAIRQYGAGLHQPLPLIKGDKEDGGWVPWEAEGVRSCREEMEMELELAAGRRGIKKIKRMRPEQVRVLEASYQQEQKLEPAQKQELALQLGLHPRQVAIWYQNRRARSKSKQLELDFARLSSRYRTLLAETHHLKSQVARLTKELNNVETRMHGLPLKPTSNGTSLKGDMLEGISLKYDILGVNTKDKVNVEHITKECPSPCSAYSVIVDCESSSSMGLRDITSAYECANSLDCSYLSQGWIHDDRLLAMYGSNSSNYNMQPQDLLLEELITSTNSMIHTPTDRLWESTT